MFWKSPHFGTFVSGILILSIVFAGTIWYLNREDDEVLSIYHAGSLVIPFAELEKTFESEHPGVDVRREVSGSALAIRKVTELGKSPDIVVSADHTLISDMMVNGTPKWADWNIQFARNQMVLAYGDHSKYHGDINKSNWFDILLRADVKFGFSNPNDDPCGYRTMMVIQLAELHYERSDLFDGLIEKNTGIECVDDGVNYSITVPRTSYLSPNTKKIMIRSAEVDLLTALDMGEIDYLFIYRSVAYQHASEGVRFLEFPPDIDLSDVSSNTMYGKVMLTQASGNVIRAKPIVYGITIPSTVSNVGIAMEFVEMLLGSVGVDIFTSCGQPPIVPAVALDNDVIPDSLKKYV